MRVPFARNCVIFARRSGTLPTPGNAAWRLLERSDTPGDLNHLLSLLEVPGAWRRVTPDEGQDIPILTDDRNPIDQLQRESIRVGRRAWHDE